MTDDSKPQLTQSTHTPGPWHVSKHRDRRDMLICDADGFEVARACYPNRNSNADLIAAAPELLRALQGMMDAYLDLTSESEPNYKSYEFRESKWQAARTAIQNALGYGNDDATVNKT